MKKAVFIILVLFFAYGTFTAPDIESSDRDNAVIISAKALMNLQNPYDYKTEIGQVITTGLFSSFISIPFVYLFGNIQLLSFLFYFVFLILIYRSNYFAVFAFAIILLSPFLYRIMHYRLDELYWVVFYIFGLFYFKSKWKYLLIVPIIFSRNIFNFNFQVLLYNIDYWLLIIIIYTFTLLKFLHFKNYLNTNRLTRWNAGFLYSCEIVIIK